MTRKGLSTGEAVAAASRCPVTGLPVQSPDRWRYGSPGGTYSFAVELIAGEIILFRTVGYITADDARAAVNLYREIAAETGLEERPFVIMDDYSQIKGAQSAARRIYIDYFQQRPNLLAAILFNVPPLFRFGYRLAKRLHIDGGIGVHVMADYASAVTLARKILDDSRAGREPHPTEDRVALEHSGRPPVPGDSPEPRPARPDLQEYVDDLLMFISGINWESGGVRDYTVDIDPDHPFRPVYDALAFIKSDLDGLFEERNRAEAEVNAYQERLRRLAGELVSAEERQSRRIALALHDIIGQPLAAAGLNLEALRRRMVTKGFEDELEEVRAILGQTISAAGILTTELSPPIVYELGLWMGIDWLADRFNDQHGLAVDTKLAAAAEPEDQDMKILLFRAVQELLTNVTRHSAATRVLITAKCDGHQVCITVTDNGKGFNLADPAGQGPGIGLFGIRERLEPLGGKIDIENAKPSGARVRLTAPLKRE